MGRAAAEPIGVPDRARRGNAQALFSDSAGPGPVTAGQGPARMEGVR
jgi:hypothetical protein